MNKLTFLATVATLALSSTAVLAQGGIGSQNHSAFHKPYVYTPAAQADVKVTTPENESGNGIAQQETAEINISATVPQLVYIEAPTTKLDFTFTKLFETRTTQTPFKVLANTPHTVTLSTNHTIQNSDKSFLPFDVNIDGTTYASGHDRSVELGKNLGDKDHEILSKDGVTNYKGEEHVLSVSINNAAALHGQYSGKVTLTIKATN
ncbi:MAG: hypothetical protein J0G29_02575 [Alphaproteobacteria bacterium]|nr:hypothetical protein [Alphaproteobacteria bacterium]OJV47171.1 MAG: hypothetical protein BGO28_01895 [Alphaproteobacteria bacterium 43-37]